jgi:cytidine deaminase
VGEVSAASPQAVTPPADMSAADVELLRIAEQLLGRVWVHGRHEVATALRTPDGQVFTGVHVDGACRRSTVCAEGVAMGNARAGLAAAQSLHIDAIVSVQIKPAERFRVIAPCGVCRELISDYSPDTRVWITADERITQARALDLLPWKSRRNW